MPRRLRLTTDVKWPIEKQSTVRCMLSVRLAIYHGPFSAGVYPVCSLENGGGRRLDRKPTNDDDIDDGVLDPNSVCGPPSAYKLPPATWATERRGQKQRRNRGF